MLSFQIIGLIGMALFFTALISGHAPIPVR